MTDATVPTNYLTRRREKQPKVGISACLTGVNVRYDGGNKYHRLIQQELSPWLNFQPICPEVEAGLGVPRPPVNLVQTSTGLQGLGATNKKLNVTDKLQSASEKLAKSHCQHLCAYIVKARSPSCGAGSTPLYDIDGKQVDAGDGLFVQALKTALPDLMIVEEDSFSDIQTCREFVALCYRLWMETQQVSGK